MPFWPLAGIRVVDFGWVLAGAIPGHIISDLGAQVIKVETRKRLDFMRQGLPLIGDKRDPEQNPQFHNVNRGKLSFAVDMEDPKGRKLLARLICISDAAIENFSPNVLRRFDLDYEHLREIKPDIVMISMAAAGQDGPISHIRTYASTINALSGLDSLSGYEGEPPKGVQQAYSDHNAAIHAAYALLAALWHRQRTGQGQYIDLAQWESVVSVGGEAIMEYIMNGRVLGTRGNYDPVMAPHGTYPCEGEDKWVSIAVKTEEEWRGFSKALGNPSWTQDPRFADQASRLRNRSALDQYVAQWTRNHTHYEVMEILQREGVAAAPVLNVEERFFDPHLKERKDYVELAHPILGAEFIYGPFWKSSADMGGVQHRAPLLGEHNPYLLTELLGVPDPELQQLVKEDVLR